VLALPSIPWLGLVLRVTRHAWLSLLLALSVSGPARAQPHEPPPVAERDVQARRLFEQGREAYNDGRYRDAWAHFHEAYQLSGRPELLFNIGQTADRLGQESDALKAFSMYLERLPAAANRKDVENRVRALRDRVDASQARSQQQPVVVAPPRQPPRQAPAPVPAQPSATRQPPLPTPPKLATTRPREPRRGFLLRAAIGVGQRGDAISRTTQGSLFVPGSTTEYSTTGWGLALDLGVGWGVLPGFAIGGGLFLDWASSPTLLQNGSESQLAAARLTTIGPFLDWYPVRKTLGWYILGGFGLAVLAYKNAANNSNGISGDGYGIGVLLGTGYEFNLSTSVGLGIELRFMTAILGEAVSGQATSHLLTAPSLLASFTWF
jgi:tetratricopeptide (TPR) repeat protein